MVGSKLNQLWALRFAQKSAECRRLIPALREELGLQPPLDTAGPQTLLTQSTSEKFPEARSLSLLLASLDRAEGRRDTAREVIALAAEETNRRALREDFLLAIQRGLTFFVDGDYSNALDRFLVARDEAETSPRRAMALMNLVLCLENLGLPLEDARTELRIALSEAALDTEENAKLLLTAIEDQREALEMRLAFRRGRISDLMSRELTLPVTQAVYYRLWVGELPFHRYYRLADHREREGFILASPYFHLKNHRLRTLQGIVHPDDSRTFRLSELVDRLYLWTWRWLADPVAFPADKLASQLKLISLPVRREFLSAEDTCLLRNVLLWISLFCPARSGMLRRQALSLGVFDTSAFPLLDFDAGVARWLLALRNSEASAREALVDLQRHELWNHPDIRFSDLVAQVLGEKSSEISSLATRLRSVCGVATSTTALTVDLASFRLIRPGQMDVVSEAACLALELLRSKDGVEASEVSAVCFGIARFDTEIHQARVFNLLSRLRALVPPNLTFRFRAGRVYAEGDWSEVRFERLDEVTLALESLATLSERAPAAPPSRRAVKPMNALKNIRMKGPLTREQIEALTGASRSTVTRLLNRWLEEGRVTKIGRAKNTHYTWVEREKA